MVNALTQNARYMYSIPTLGTIFPIFIASLSLGAVTMIVYKAHDVWLLNPLCVYIYIYIYTYICKLTARR